MKVFITSQMMPNITPRQKERNSIISQHADEKNMHDFILDAYVKITEMFDIYKIPPPKTKCYWCVMCCINRQYSSAYHH